MRCHGVAGRALVVEPKANWPRIGRILASLRKHKPLRELEGVTSSPTNKTATRAILSRKISRELGPFWARRRPQYQHPTPAPSTYPSSPQGSPIRLGVTLGPADWPNAYSGACKTNLGCLWQLLSQQSTLRSQRRARPARQRPDSW